MKMCTPLVNDAKPVPIILKKPEKADSLVDARDCLIIAAD
jgi:hypothetical protein